MPPVFFLVLLKIFILPWEPSDGRDTRPRTFSTVPRLTAKTDISRPLSNT